MRDGRIGVDADEVELVMPPGRLALGSGAGGEERDRQATDHGALGYGDGGDGRGARAAVRVAEHEQQRSSARTQAIERQLAAWPALDREHGRVDLQACPVSRGGLERIEPQYQPSVLAQQL